MFGPRGSARAAAGLRHMLAACFEEAFATVADATWRLLLATPGRA
ncbi:hypothetical protein [Actinocorallia aurea]